MKHLVGLMLGALLCSMALAAKVNTNVDAKVDKGDIRCLRSVGPNKPIRLQFSLSQANLDKALVRYEHGSAAIPLRHLATKSVETAPGRPFEFTTTWKEATPGGGTYTVVSQGARVYGFSFVRGQDHKRFEFVEDEEAYDANGCKWKRS